MYIILWGIKQIWCLQQLTITNKQYFCRLILVKSLPFGQFLELALLKSQFGCCFECFFFFNYVFIYGCAGSLLLRRLSLVAVSGAALHLSLRASLWWLLSLQSTGSRARAPQLQHVGLEVVAHKLSCPEACGTFPDQGSNPCSLHWQARSQPLDQQKSPDSSVLKFYMFVYFFAALGLCYYPGFSLAVKSRGYTLVVVLGLLVVVASLVVEHRLQGSQASVVGISGLQLDTCGLQAELLHRMWDLSQIRD